MLLIKKSLFTYIFILFFFISPTLADTLNQERKFNIYAKLSLVPKIKIMEISTLLNVENEINDNSNEELSPNENFKGKDLEDMMIDQNSLANESKSTTNGSFDNSINNNNEAITSFEVKRTNQKITTISNAIRAAGGITSKTDLSRIEIIRDIPIGKGGGRKRAFIDFSSFLLDNLSSRSIFPLMERSNKER